ESWRYCAAPKVEVASTAGAGDSLLGGGLAAITAGIPFVRAGSSGRESDAWIDSALELGVFLASYKCQSPHTIHPGAQLESLVEFVRNDGRRFSSRIEQFIAPAEPSGRSVSS